jgi:hypothetical protein
VKYDPDGTRLWEVRYEDPANNEDLGVDLVLNSNANVYVTSQSKGVGSPYHDYATIIYETNGNPLWVGRYDGPAQGIDRSQDIEIEADGNVYITGNSWNGANYDFTTIKYTEFTPLNAFTSLTFVVEDMELEHGIENSVNSKLNNILKSLTNGRENAAVNQLQD